MTALDVAGELRQLPVDEIDANPGQPRTVFDKAKLAELEASIAENGVLQPILVRPKDDGRFELIAGERRWRCATKVGLASIPALIRPTADRAALVQAIEENIRRADLLPTEEAAAYKRLEELGQTQGDIAKVAARSQSHISKRVALLDLPAAVRRDLDSGRIGVTHAELLLKLREHPKALEAAHKEALRGVDPAEQPATQQVDRAVQGEINKIELAEKIDSLKAEAKAKGWKTVPTPKGWNDKVAWRKVASDRYASPGAQVDVSPKKHEAEPCHAVLLDTRNVWKASGVKLEPVCTDPGRHKPKGDSALKMPVQKRPKKSKRELEAAEQDKQRREAGKRHRAHLAGVIGKQFSARASTGLIATALIAEMRSDNAQVACELLGLDVPKQTYGGHDYVGALTKAADASDPVKVALVCAIGRGLVSLKQDYGWRHTTAGELWAFLDATGYQRAPWEDQALADGRKELAEDEAMDDPIPPAWEVDGPGDDGSWVAYCESEDEWDVHGPTERDVRLAAAVHMLDAHDVRCCFVCGCSDNCACEDGCYWLADHLCSSCANAPLVVDDVDAPQLNGPRPDLSNRAACLDFVLNDTTPAGALMATVRAAATQEEAEAHLKARLFTAGGWAYCRQADGPSLVAHADGVQCAHIGVKLSWAELAHHARKGDVEVSAPTGPPAVRRRPLDDNADPDIRSWEISCAECGVVHGAVAGTARSELLANHHQIGHGSPDNAAAYADAMHLDIPADTTADGSWDDQPPPAVAHQVSVKRKPRTKSTWLFRCDTCGFEGHQTTEAYANERAGAHRANPDADLLVSAGRAEVAS